MFTLLFCFVCRLGSVDSGQNILSRTFCPELFIVSSNLFTSHRHCGCPTGVYHRLTTPFRKWCRPPARAGPAALRGPQPTLLRKTLTPSGVSVFSLWNPCAERQVHSFHEVLSPHSAAPRASQWQAYVTRPAVNHFHVFFLIFIL